MFAYCGNNPVNCFDDTGCAPQAVSDKVIHDMILMYICAQNKSLTMINTCIYYNGKNAWGGWGFCDLYNTQTGEVWELKKDSNSYSCRTSKALSQLKKYTTGRLKKNKNLELHIPYKTTIKDGHFSFVRNGYIYDVDYWSEGNGILRYKYDRRKINTEGTATAIVIAVILITVSILFPCAAPSGSGIGSGLPIPAY